MAQREPLRHGPVVTSQAGDGPDLVLIHGLAGSGDWWAHNQPALTTAFRVTTIDLPGFGTSHSEAKDQLPTGEWQVSHGAEIDALDALGSPRTQRAAGEAVGCGKVQRDRLAVERHVLEAETSQVRKER